MDCIDGTTIRVLPLEADARGPFSSEGEEWRRTVEHAVAAAFSSEFQRAERLLSSALGLAETQSGSDQEVAITLNNLGTIYKFLGRPSEARRAYLRGLSVSERNGESNPMLGAALMTNLTRLHTPAKPMHWIAASPRPRQPLPM